MADNLLRRFLRYVQIDTHSSEDSPGTPSTACQWDLLRLLAQELEALGAADVELTEHGYVLASVPATSRRRQVPALAFLAHVDTVSLPNLRVKPIVHRKWNGRPIHLPDDPAQVLDPAVFPRLAAARGQDIVTASGLSILGADDKAGVASVMTVVDYLLKHPDIKHGPIRVCFNPDEEIGHGVDKLDLGRLGANVAYTLDGENPGEIAWETFSGDQVLITIEGVSTHPGEAKKYGMVNAVHLAGKLLAALPREGLSPETTEGRQGYLHPTRIEGGVERAALRFILRDYELAGLDEKAARLKGLCAGLQAAEPRARITFRRRAQYRNMGYWLKDDMRPVELAYQAMRQLGLTPTSPAARGGTDGSRLTERGLPTPNLFCGGHNAHGPLEWASVQEMELAVQTCVELAQLWEREGVGYQGWREKGEARKGKGRSEK